jgi:ribosomal-protein-alanine N-acetyltransferase
MGVEVYGNEINIIMNIDFFNNLFENNLPGFSIDKEEINDFSKDIYFERLSISGLEEMHRYSIDVRLYEYLEFDPFLTIDQTRAYLEKLLNRISNNGDKSAMYWFIRRKSDDYLIGTAGIVNINFNRKSAEWGYGIDPELWGYGYIFQIQEALKYYVFEILNLNRLEGITMINNEKTKSSLIACGMKNEGILRQFYCKNENFIDGWKYSMLKDEYILGKQSSFLSNINKYTMDDIINVLKEVLNEEVNYDTTMYNSATWDSISHMNIIVKFHEKFKIELSPIQIANATSVESLFTLINNL